MSSTLLLRLAGPMQSWGVQSRFTNRDTGLEPSKSGVIGLLCAALGRPRHAPVVDLTGLTLGVRVDRQGLLKMDYHTAGGSHHKGEKYGVAKADGGKPDTVVSHRYYLADADFLVGLEGDEALLRRLDAALARPVWPLYLGRKAFVPGAPVRLAYRPPDLPGPTEVPGLVHLPLQAALVSYPWLARTHREKERMHRQVDEAQQTGRTVQLRLVLDTPFGRGAEVRPDVPLSFAKREFTIRHVKTDFMPLNLEMIQEATYVSLSAAS
ncbi:MAG: type I-E CRISPR-associated protein Cas5/CasD [Deltaproteobacteria bacterium]|nr:type I-E CRISPR-associated protein Cas5/CasD [Deltaproteobacteria bacterium]